MLDSKLLEELAQKLSTLLPESVYSAKCDFQQTIKQILQSSLAKLELVSREEFDAQTKVLQRTRAKLDAIAEELSTLEQKIMDSAAKPEAK